MTILYLIVARSGSKRILGKNMRPINELPLVAYKAIAAKKAQSCSLAMISTDCPIMADVARQFGVSIQFIRPDYLATDTTTTEDVIRHAIGWITDMGTAYDAIMLLEPSSPFVPPSAYDAAVELMEQKHADFVFGHVLYLFRWDYLVGRTDLYDHMNGKAVYFPMLTQEAVDIDTPHDLEHAQWLAENGYVDLSWTS